MTFGTKGCEVLPPYVVLVMFVPWPTIGEWRPQVSNRENHLKDAPILAPATTGQWDTVLYAAPFAAVASDPANGARNLVPIGGVARAVYWHWGLLLSFVNR